MKILIMEKDEYHLTIIKDQMSFFEQKCRNNSNSLSKINGSCSIGGQDIHFPSETISNKSTLTCYRKSLPKCPAKLYSTVNVKLFVGIMLELFS